MCAPTQHLNYKKVVVGGGGGGGGGGDQGGGIRVLISVIGCVYPQINTIHCVTGGINEPGLKTGAGPR